VGKNLVIGVFSDIHGNLEALKATIYDGKKNGVANWICLGDLFFKGPQPLETAKYIESMIEKDTVTFIKGNTDEFITQSLSNNLVCNSNPELAPYLDFIQSKLPKQFVIWLDNLKNSFTFNIADQEFNFFHSSLKGLNISTYPDMNDIDLLNALSPKTELHKTNLFYGHIHLPYMRKIKDISIFNTGSVGMPFDMDYRASYIIIDIDDENGLIKKSSFIKVHYDLEKLIAAAKKVCLPGLEQYLNILKLTI